MKLRLPLPPLPTWLGARAPRAWRVHAARRDIRREMHRVADGRRSLADFDTCSTGEFSGLAECLSTLHTRLGEVAAEAASLDRVLQDRDGDRAHQSAFDLYKKSVDLAHASIGIALSQEEEMEQLEARLLQNRTQFTQNSLMFRVLVLNIRAESARPEIDPAHRAVFASVADDMAAMGTKMTTTVDAAFNELEVIVDEAATGRKDLETLKQSLHVGAKQSIALLRSELELIKHSLAPCAEANAAITDLLTRARNQTGDLITALQFQDIVRQQLEHVGQGFDDIAGHVGTNGSRQNIDLAYLRHAARVQQTHLKGSRQAIEEAGRKIGSAGTALLATGSELVSRFETMERVAAGAFSRSQLGTLFKTETATLVEIAGQSEATNERIARLLDRIEKAIRVFSSEISHHEFDVQLITLNAQVAATRIPEALALNKLTEETAHLAAATATLTSTMSNQLRDTLVRLQAMRDEAARVRETIGREKTELTSSSVSVDAKLARLNDRILKSSSETSQHFNAAYEQVRTQVGSLQFPLLIAGAYAPAEELCVRLIDTTAPFADVELSAAGRDALAVHQSRYTMEDERNAHLATVQAPGTPAPAAPADDGLELFGDDPAPAPADGSITVTAADLAAAPPPAAEKPADDGVELF